jgi:hypothetical protein
MGVVARARGRRRGRGHSVVSAPAGQLTIGDELEVREAERQGFTDWDVFELPAPARRWLTAAELAARWGKGEEQARMFLEDFERAGYAVRRGEYWRASDRALQLHLVDRDGMPL